MQAFQETMVNGPTLLTLTDDTLKDDLYITNKVLRTRLLLDIDQLRLRSMSVSPPGPSLSRVLTSSSGPGRTEEPIEGHGLSGVSKPHDTDCQG